jgi:hypothetical protein
MNELGDKRLRFCSGLVLALIALMALSTTGAAQSPSASCSERADAFAPAASYPVEATPGPHQLTLEFVDVQGLPTAARVGVFVNGDAVVPDPPEDYLFQAIAQKSYFYTLGTVTLNVPEGPVQIYACKGFEFEPVDVVPIVVSDKTVRIVMRRWTDLRLIGWYPGDTHTHLTHPPVNLILEPQDMMNVMQAEELHFLNVMDQEEYFTGAPDDVSMGDRIVYFSKEYRNPHFGHLSLVGLDQWINTVSCFPETWRACGRTLNSQVAEQVHAQSNALMIITHPLPVDQYTNLHAWPGGGIARGMPLDLVGDHADAVDLLCYTNLPPPEGIEEYTQALNAGFRLPVSAGTDAVLSRGYSFPPGGFRVYSHVDEAAQQFTSDEWINGVRRGETFVSNAPLFTVFMIDGRGIGSRIETTNDELWGFVNADCAWPLDKVEILADGHVIAEFTPAPLSDGHQIFGSFTVPTTGVQWVAARAVGSMSPWAWHTFDAAGLFAQTSPIYIHRTDGDPDVVDSDRCDAARYFVSRLDQLQALFDEHGLFPDGSRAVFDSAVANARHFYNALVPDPPEAFSLITPAFWSDAHNSLLTATTTPTFIWQEAVDTDPDDQVTYRLTYATHHGLLGATTVDGIEALTYTIPADKPLTDQTLYFFKLEAVDLTGRTTMADPGFSMLFIDVTATGVDDRAPTGLALLSTVPNPFNPSTTIAFSVDEPAHVRLRVFDVGGRAVRTLIDGPRGRGEHSVMWDGHDGRGNAAGSGVYFVRLESGGQTRTRKIVLLK